MKTKKTPFLRLINGLFLLCAALSANVHGKKASSLPPSEDVILQWNRVLGQTLQIPDIQPGNINTVRSFAMMHLAMFDAVNSIDGTYTPYLTDVPGTRYASTKVAAAKAAYDVLSALYPSRQAVFDAEFAVSLDGVSPNRNRQAIRVGEITSAAILANRANDGWSAPWTPYLLAPTAGNWQELFPGPYPGFAVFTNWPSVRPFALTSGTQFLPAPPPALSSAEYAASLNEVKGLGSVASLVRTADQTLTALLWANPPVSDGLMSGVVRSTAIDRNNSTVENARLFALVYMAFHDALQTTFTSQYHYGLWRPVTAIRRANEDGNPDTAPDAGWESLLGPGGTPPHPSYASNASSASSSVATTLALFYGRDDIQFTIDFGGGVNRNYRSFSALTNEIARSRVFGGVHFPFDTAAGQSAGRNVANYVYQNLLTQRRCDLF
ncbi:MAG: vanadium-dependent haloperoxidase [Pyrinomonadaceae bacterium]